jgi:hypothetical protein
MGLKVVRSGIDPNVPDPEDEVVPPDGEPSSHTRAKKSSNRSRLLVANMNARTAGLEGPELEAEIERFIERVIEHHVKAAPEAFRDELRRTLRSVVENDPAVSAVVKEMRGGG